MYTKRFVIAVVALTLLARAALAAGPVRVDIFSGFQMTGGGAPYSGFVGSFTSPDVMFATNTGFLWHPFDQHEFGADITGILRVAADGNYSFTLTSDDGSLLFIDGNLVIDNGGGHAPQTAMGAVFLTAGTHRFEVQFFECCDDPSGVDLILPAGVTYFVVPAAPALSRWGLIGLAGLLVGIGFRQVRRRAWFSA